MLKIRKAVINDAESILQIAKQAFEKYIKQAEISDTAALHENTENVISDINNKIVLVAEYDGNVVGSVRLKISENNTAYLSRFCVSNEYQKLGIGRELIAAVDAEAEKHGLKRVELHTASRAFTLVRFYYEKGFYIDSTTKDMGYVRALMVKDY